MKKPTSIDREALSYSFLEPFFISPSLANNTPTDKTLKILYTTTMKTTTFFTFVGDQFGKAEEAITFYTSLFDNSEIKQIERYQDDQYGEKDGFVKHAIFTIAGQEYMASESSLDHKFTFTPAISIFVTCETKEEQEMLFETLSEGGEIMLPLDNYGFSERFGWVGDRYGVSWQLNLK